MSRGDIWTATGGVYASKPRPVLIVQDDRFDGTESITVLPLTSTDGGSMPLFRFPVVPGPTSGLTAESWVMVDKITTVRRARMDRYVGRLSATEMVAIERLVIVFLGLAS